MSGRNSLSDTCDTVMNHSSGDFTNGSNRAFYFCEFWNHIGCRASVELSDGKDTGVKDIDATSDHRLQGLNNFTCRGNWIQSAEWFTGVSALTDHTDRQGVA